MLALTFQVGDNALALDIRRVHEVVPRVRLRSLSGAPEWLAGVFVYRGDVVPVVDLHRLAGAAGCPPHLSSRIILVPCRFAAGAERLIGLLATRVDDLRELKPEGHPAPSMRAADQADFGAVYATGQGVIRLFDPDRFLPDTVWQQLLCLPREAGP
jgi:chemotaxis-related protein WspB